MLKRTILSDVLPRPCYIRVGESADNFRGQAIRIEALVVAYAGPIIYIQAPPGFSPHCEKRGLSELQNHNFEYSQDGKTWEKFTDIPFDQEDPAGE